MVKDDGESVVFVDTSAGRVCCRESGTGEGRLLLLHGSSFSKDVFVPLSRHPALCGFRIVAIDLPGHGQSEDARDPVATYRISGFASVVSEIVSALRLQDCVVLGWSLGGDIAMEFFQREPAVLGLALVGAPPVPAGIFGKLRGYTLTGARLAAKPEFSREDALRFERQCIRSTSDGRFVGDLMRTDPRMRPQLARSAFADRHRDQRRAFRASTKPVWLVAGAEDPLVRISYLRKLGRFCAEGREPWIVPGAGHAPFLDYPDAFATRLAHFARAAVPAGRPAGPACSPDPHAGLPLPPSSDGRAVSRKG